MNPFTDRITSFVESGFGGLWVQTHEIDEAQRLLNGLATQKSWDVLQWDAGRGFSDPLAGTTLPNTLAPMAFSGLPPKKTETPFRLVCLWNLHRYFQNPVLLQALANRVLAGKAVGDVTLILSPVLELPPEIEKLFVALDHPLPTVAELRGVMETIGWDGDKVIETGAVEAAVGLTHLEAENAFSLSLHEYGTIRKTTVWDQKVQAVKKQRFLSLHRGTEDFASLGGLFGLKEFGLRILNSPSKLRRRGLMLLGVPGVGKSMYAKALGRETGRPTFQLDMGSLHNKFVGESEAAIKQALKLADAMAPCILFLDEVEKGLAGHGSDNDSGVSSRIFGTLLTWVQDHESDVFLVATSNNISRLPPEFTRSERFDRTFFLDLPTQTEREAIWNLYRTRYEISPNTLPVASDENWTGADIHACCRIAALLQCSILEASDGIVPVATSAADKVQSLRQWADGRVICATTGKIFTLSPTVDSPPQKRRVHKKSEEN